MRINNYLDVYVKVLFKLIEDNPCRIWTNVALKGEINKNIGKCKIGNVKQLGSILKSQKRIKVFKHYNRTCEFVEYILVKRDR